MAIRFLLITVFVTLAACAGKSSRITSVSAYMVEGERQIVTCHENGDCFYFDEGARRPYTPQGNPLQVLINKVDS